MLISFAASRKWKKALQGWFDNEGNWREDDAGMEEVVIDYFAKMFQASVIDYGDINTTLEAIKQL